MNRLKDKVCIVTAAALGIGRMCFAVGAGGARLALFDMLDVEDEDLVTELKARGFDTAYWHVDVARRKWRAPSRMLPHAL